MKINTNKSLEFSSDSLFHNRIGNEWLSTSEAAQALRITPNALRILVCRGKVQFFKFGRHLRFRWKDINSLLRKGA